MNAIEAGGYAVRRTSRNTFGQFRARSLVTLWQLFLDRPIDSFGTDIISCMMRLNLVPSPHPEVVVSRYDEALFPEFRPLFEGTEAPRFLPPGFRYDPSQASTVTVVLENRSEKGDNGLKLVPMGHGGRLRHAKNIPHMQRDIYSHNENEGSSSLSVVEGLV